METTLRYERLALRKLWWIGPLTIVLASIANCVIRAVAVAFFGVSETLQYMQFPSIIGGTTVYLLLALIVFVLVGRFARNPIRFYRIVVLVALCASFLTPIMALVGFIPEVGMNLAIFWTMIAMHIASALLVFILFTTLARARVNEPGHSH